MSSEIKDSELQLSDRIMRLWRDCWFVLLGMGLAGLYFDPANLSVGDAIATAISYALWGLVLVGVVVAVIQGIHWMANRL